MVNSATRSILLLLFALWVSSSTANAQRNAYWIEGKVTFKNGDTQYCVLNYDATVSEGLLQIKEDRKILTYTVRDVERFSFFDDRAEQWRRFYAVPLYLARGKVSRDFFMELVYSGSHWSILRKKERWVGSLAYRKLSPESYVLQRPEKKFKYARYYEICYLLDMKTGRIEELTKELLLASVSDEEQMIERFMREHQLRLHEVEDYVTLLDYYHRLTKVADEQSGIVTPPVGPIPAK